MGYDAKGRDEESGISRKRFEGIYQVSSESITDIDKRIDTLREKILSR